MNYNNNLLLLYILCTLQLQPYHKSMASKPSPCTSTFIEEGQGTKPQVPHGNPDVPTTSAHSYAVPKCVTDVATLISASVESSKMFLTEVTRTCLEAAKTDREDINKAIASQLVQTPTNTNITGLVQKQFIALLYLETLQLHQLHHSLTHQAQQ